MRNRSTLGVFDVTHNQKAVAVGDGLGTTSTIDVVEFGQTVYHKLGIIKYHYREVTEYTADCGRDMDNPAVVAKAIASKILDPCQECWR